MPLIAHSIHSGLEVFDRVFVSTDDDEIEAVARSYGATVIRRPRELARDDTPMAPVVEHAIEHCTERHGAPERLFLLQPTSPLRSAQDIRTAQALMQGDCDSVMGVYEASHPPEWELRGTPAGYLTPAVPVDERAACRQELAPTYCGGPLFAIETGAFCRYHRFLTDATAFFVLPAWRAVDIDTELDFQFAEFLIERASREEHT